MTEFDSPTGLSVPGARLVSSVAAAIDAIPTFDDEVAAELRGMRDRITEPLRVVVAGRLKSGKSTLVNALLGQRVAPTDVGECTRVVTWYRYGFPQRLEIRLRDGSVVERSFSGDLLPNEFEGHTAEIESLHVWLSNATLRAFSLIDTPGLASLDTASSDATKELLTIEASSTAAAADADALLFVLNSSLRSDELEVLEAFNRARQVSGSAANAIAVLTKADKVGDGTEPWNAATTLAKKLAERLSDQVLDVVPLIGLLAETARTAALDDGDIALLRQFAELPPSKRNRAFISGERFLAAEVDVTTEDRHRLLSLLDLFGIERATDLLQEGSIGGARMSRELTVASGFNELQEALVHTFTQKSGALRAWRTLEELRQLAYRPKLNTATSSRLRAEVEHLRLGADLHQVAELEALHRCCTGEVRLPALLDQELRQIVLGVDDLAPMDGSGAADDPTSRRAALCERASRWRTFALTASPLQASVARTVIRGCRLDLSELEANLPVVVPPVVAPVAPPAPEGDGDDD